MKKPYGKALACFVLSSFLSIKPGYGIVKVAITNTTADIGYDDGCQLIFIPDTSDARYVCDQIPQKGNTSECPYKEEGDQIYKRAVLVCPQMKGQILCNKAPFEVKEELFILKPDLKFTIEKNKSWITGYKYNCTFMNETEFKPEVSTPKPIRKK